MVGLRKKKDLGKMWAVQVLVTILRFYTCRLPNRWLMRKVKLWTLKKAHVASKHKKLWKTQQQSFLINWKLCQVSYRHIPHFSQWYGFLSKLSKSLQIAQKYADIFSPQLQHLPLSLPIWKEMIWKIIGLTDQVSANYDHTKFLT